MHERGIRIRIRVAFVSLDVSRGEKEKERKKKNKNNQEEYSTTDEEERRGEERRVYEFRMDGWMRGEGNVKRQEPPPPSLCTALHRRIMVEPCLDRALWDVIAVRARGEYRNPDRSVTVLTFATTTKTSFCQSFRATQRSTFIFFLVPLPSSESSLFRSILIPNAFNQFAF